MADNNGSQQNTYILSADNNPPLFQEIETLKPKFLKEFPNAIFPSVQIIESNKPVIQYDGDYIQVSTKTLQTLNSKQIASVMAHELAHVVLKHGDQIISMQHIGIPEKEIAKAQLSFEPPADCVAAKMTNATDLRKAMEILSDEQGVKTKEVLQRIAALNTPDFAKTCSVEVPRATNIGANQSVNNGR